MASNSIRPKLEVLLNRFRSSPPNTINSNNSIQNQFNGTKRAAVLICLFEGNDGNLRVILTKRASSLSSHSGEVSLPGGKRDEGDANDVETALREAKEEIGLDPSLVTVMTILEPFTSKLYLYAVLDLSTVHRMHIVWLIGVHPFSSTLRLSLPSNLSVSAYKWVFLVQYAVTVIPVIGLLPGKDAFTPVLNSSEVEAIFDVPLEMFLKNDNRREREERRRQGEKHLVHYFDYEVDNRNYVIWAITAAILIRAASVIYQRPPEFLELRPKIWGGITENDKILLQHGSKL